MSNASSKLTIGEFLRGYAPIGIVSLIFWTIGSVQQHRINWAGAAILFVGWPLVFWVGASITTYFIRRHELHQAVATLSILSSEEIAALLRTQLLANGYTEVIDYGTTTTVEYRKLPPLGEEGDQWLPARPAS
jgi:hypothetical protein